MSLAFGALLLVAGAGGSAGQDVTATQVDDWLVAYSAARSSDAYPYLRLLADVRRVVECESAHFDIDVLNNRWRGTYGEIGAFQFMPGSRSIYYQSETAQAGWPMTDPEANVAAGVDLISRGLGPRHWTCF